MFKGLFLTIFVIFFFSSANADFFLVSPIEQQLFDGGTVDLGDVSSGQFFEIIISNESAIGQDIRFQKAIVMQDALPSGWSVENSKEGEKRLVVKVFVPKTALPNIYQLKVTGINNEFGLQEEFTVRVRIKEGLLRVAINNPTLNQFPQVGEEIAYNIVLINNSIAPATIKVNSTLPSEWFTEKEIKVAPKETINTSFKVVPLVAGRKDFKIIVFSNAAEKEIASFDSSLNIRPTLLGKFSAGTRGLPFFSFSFFTFHFFNSFIVSIFG